MRDMPRLSIPLLLVCAGCTQSEAPVPSSPDTGSQGTDSALVCTAAACFDTAKISATFRRSAASLGKHEFALMADGRSANCTVDFDDAAQDKLAACHGDITVILSIGPAKYPKEVDEGGRTTTVLVPSHVELEWVLDVLGHPAQVHVTHSAGGQTLVDRTATFSVYETFRPNGDRCPPVCMKARTEWKLP